MPQDPGVRQAVLYRHHDDPYAGHFGAERTLELVQRKYYWEGLAKDVAKYIRACATCQTMKVPRRRPQGEMAPLRVPTGVWIDITMDLITGLPPAVWSRDGLVYDTILVIMDCFSKMAIYIPCNETIIAVKCADLVRDFIVTKYGTPRSIVTDQGSIFTSGYWSEMCQAMRVKHRMSTAFHSQTDGQTERTNQTLEFYLRLRQLQSR